MTDPRLQRALAAIDEYNRRDPKTASHEGRAEPGEWVYSLKLTGWVKRLAPEPSAALQVVARGQHIGRWTIPREKYPMDRGGYLRWREALKVFHADTVGAILRQNGFEEPFVERVRSLILKKNLKTDPEAQTVEDALCLLFLETQFADLKSKTEDEKMREIVRKTWNKMSERGRALAGSVPLAPDLAAFLKETLT